MGVHDLSFRIAGAPRHTAPTLASRSTPPGRGTWWRTFAPWCAAYTASGLAVVVLGPVFGVWSGYPTMTIGAYLLWRTGRAAWPLLVVADLAVAGLFQGPHAGLIAITAAITLVQSGLVVLVLRWWSLDDELGETRDVIGVALAGVAAATVGATLGAAFGDVLWRTGHTDLDWGDRWGLWTAGDLAGSWIYLPVLLLVTSGAPAGAGARLAVLRARLRLRSVPAFAAALALAATSFGPVEPASDPKLRGLQFLILIPLLWLALVDDVLVTMAACLVVDVVALSATAPSVSPIAAGARSLIPLQLFMATTSIGALLVAVTVRSERRRRGEVRTLLTASPLAIVAVDLVGQVTVWNAACERLFGWPAAEALGRPLPIIPPDRREGFEHRKREILAGSVLAGIDVEYLTRDGRRISASLFAGPVHEADGRVVGVLRIIQDVSASRAASEERDRLAVAIAQATESIVITDTDAHITYVNPAVEATSGYSRAELLGQNPRIFKSGVQAPEVYEAMWAALSSGRPWSGVLVNRRKDGTHFTEAATLSPVFADDGRLAAYVGVKRDLTRERSLEESLELELREREAALDSISHLQVADSPEETALALTADLFQLDLVDVVAVFHFHANGEVIPLAVAAPAGFPVYVGEPLPTSRARYFRDRAANGAWVERWVLRPEEDPSYRDAFMATGLVASMFAPIRWADRLIGLLGCGTLHPDGFDGVPGRLTTVSELAAHAGPLLGPHLVRRDDVDATRQRVMRVIAEAAFRPVLQPIVEAETGRLVGFEALSRFADGTRPDVMIGEARTAGVQADLELALTRASRRAAEQLPGHVWISLNVSPELLTGGHLTRELASPGVPIVIELTEHTMIADYRLVRSALRSLGPSVRLSVDDAGAGYASLRHILELGADFVKLDYSLVHGCEADPARQAMIAAMVVYAGETGTALIAEGVETEAEAATVRRLGVHLAQGFLYGRPMEVAAALDLAASS